jgi:hypothetical protein
LIALRNLIGLGRIPPAGAPPFAFVPQSHTQESLLQDLIRQTG